MKCDDDDFDLARLDRVQAANPERAAIAEAYGKRFELMVLRGHFESAGRLVDQARDDLNPKNSGLANRSLADIGLSVRTCNMLEANFQALKIVDLSRVSTRRLLSLSTVGPHTIDEIIHAVVKAIAAERSE